MRKTHPCLEVINVGQGDCMILRPQKQCVLAGTTYIIDTGDGRVDYTYYLDEDDKRISLVLTHSHKDHIGGLLHLLPKVNQIKEIILPFFYNEIILISNALENLLGIEMVALDSWPLDCLSEYENGNAVLNKLIELRSPKPIIIFGYEGRTMCNHFFFLNPPVIIPKDECDFEDRIQKIAGLFNDNFARQLRYWLTARLKDGQMSDTPFLDRHALYSVDQQTREEYKSRGLFVLSFFEQNYEIIHKFTQKPTMQRLTPVVQALNLTANQASLVFRYETQDYFEKSILFTGDIDTSVFKRMIANGDNIRTDILKVPHHGSQTGLNDEILDRINPRYAIISHKNRRFGRLKDPHPNMKTLDLLKSKGIRISVTNDVIKNKMVVLKREKVYSSIFEIK